MFYFNALYRGVLSKGWDNPDLRRATLGCFHGSHQQAGAWNPNSLPEIDCSATGYRASLKGPLLSLLP